MFQVAVGDEVEGSRGRPTGSPPSEAPSDRRLGAGKWGFGFGRRRSRGKVISGCRETQQICVSVIVCVVFSLVFVCFSFFGPEYGDRELHNFYVFVVGSVRRVYHFLSLEMYSCVNRFCF